ncbi:MAG: GNAT family N-acetyltransferase [Anaerolineales bacterium]|nr:GNAT family N-acetyltransferase [Anaerolineales bacterium]
MLSIHTPLFEAQDIRLGPIDHEKDPEVESQWTHDSEFMRLMELKPVRPLAPAMVKKEYESLEKEIEEAKNLFYFTIRAREGDRLLGMAVLEWIDWTNGNGYLRLGIGSGTDRGKGLGAQALGLLLRFAFAELNLFRVTIVIPEYCQAALALVNKFGFVEEVRRRKAILRDDRAWDLIIFGLLNSEWAGQVGA